MSPSTQSPFERAKAQISELDRVLETERDHFRTVVKAHESNIDSLKQSFRDSHQSIILDAENAFKASAEARNDLENKLKEEKQRVIELTGKLDEIEHDKTTVKLASEKVNHGLTKMALAKSQKELEEASRRVAVLEKDLEAAEQQIGDLRRECTGLKDMETRLEQLTTTNDTIKKRKDHVEAELELGQRESADLQRRLKAAEKRVTDLEADLKAATGRASGAEDELKGFKSLFQRINDDMSSLATSSGKQPVVDQSTSSAPAPNDQGSVEQTGTEHPQIPRPQVSNTASDKESTLLHCKSILDQVMDVKNWESNRYFLKAVDSLTLASRDAKVSPINLGTMQEKLDKGVYTSVPSFKADFDLMIADARALNPPQNPVRIAADQLSKVFDQAFSSLPVSGHEPRETAQSAQGINDKKRKVGPDALAASEDEPAQKRHSLAPAEQSTDRVQTATPGIRASLTPASTVSGQSKDATQGPKQTNAVYVKGQITTSRRLDIDAKLSAVAQLVSFEKSPSTITGHWKSLVPKDYWLTARALPGNVIERIVELGSTSSTDMIILRLLPADGADKPEFNRLLDYLFLKERFATVSHAGIDNVEDIYLIPAFKAFLYPRFLPTLDWDLLPPTKTEHVLLMAIIFKVAENKQMQVREAWDARMQAIHHHDEGGLISMRNTLMRNSLNIFSDEQMLLLRAEQHMLKMGHLPISLKSASPELQPFSRDILHISYPTWHKGPRPSAEGVTAPEWVFVLGRVFSARKQTYYGLLVIDLEDGNRPLWLLRRWEGTVPQKRQIALVAHKFPSSLKEWEETLPATEHFLKSHTRCLKGTGVKSERCKLPE